MMLEPTHRSIHERSTPRPLRIADSANSATAESKDVPAYTVKPQRLVFDERAQ